jgi:cell division protein FtsB
MSLATRSLPPRLVLGVMALLVAASVALGAGGMMRVWEMQRELEALEQEIERLSAETQQLAQTVEKLRNDPAYMEQLARETLGFVRPDETVLKFPSNPSR